MTTAKKQKKVTRASIDAFFQSGTIAVAGVSRKPKKFGHEMFREMRLKGIPVVPINPHADEILGEKCFKDINSLPPEIKTLLILTQKKDTPAVVEQAIGKGIQRIWMQQMSETKEAIEQAEKNNIEVIHGKCIFMFAEPVSSVHKFHRWIYRLFGVMPK